MGGRLILYGLIKLEIFMGAQAPMLPIPVPLPCIFNIHLIVLLVQFSGLCR